MLQKKQDLTDGTPSALSVIHVEATAKTSAVCDFQVMTSLSSLSANRGGSACCNDRGLIRVKPVT